MFALQKEIDEKDALGTHKQNLYFIFTKKNLYQGGMKLFNCTYLQKKNIKNARLIGYDEFNFFISIT